MRQSLAFRRPWILFPVPPGIRFRSLLTVLVPASRIPGRSCRWARKRNEDAPSEGTGIPAGAVPRPRLQDPAAHPVNRKVTTTELGPPATLALRGEPVIEYPVSGPIP